MKLLSLEYKEFEGTPQEWLVSGLTLGSKNLIVGKNASGKSRILNVLNSLAGNLSGVREPQISGNFSACFSQDDKKYEYQSICENQKVVYEKLVIDGRIVLDRGEDGKGKIFAEKIGDGSDIEFHTPTSNFAVVSRRDQVQHSFLEALYNWADSVRYYPFGTPLGKDLFAVLVPNGPKVNEKDHNAVIGIFREAQKQFGDDFIDALKKDLAEVDYHVSHIDVSSPISLKMDGPHGEPVGLYVKEKSLPGITDQFSMSQGMFRVLSLLIHVNYFQMKATASTVLIDDIGEGLDFDRSCRLINLLRAKADHNNLQLIMSTNDRFVMNSIPLDEWSVLKREANHVMVKNHKNSEKQFDDFKFTGLSNFSFLELDVLSE